MMHETEWMRHNPRPRNIKHGQKRPQPVPRSAILIASAVLVAALAVLVIEIWRMIAA